jgi:iron complex outermembrane receptor protein
LYLRKGQVCLLSEQPEHTMKKLILAVSVCSLGIAQATWGQDSSGAPAAEPLLEEVIVTGSRIKRQDYTSISPLVTLDAEQITLSGVTAVEDLVNEAPQLVPQFNRASNSPGANAAGLNLRGLGENRTLVTLNGRRLAPGDEFGAVDVNVIPSQLLKRVEIVTGGASTVYGSDAVAGVVNFIIDDEFEGFEVTAQYDTFEEGDGDVKDLSLLFGFGNDRGHITGFLNYQDREPVFAGDRPFSAERLQEQFSGPNAGELVPAGSGTTPAGSTLFPPAVLPGTGGPPVQVTFDEDGSPRAVVQGQDQYNFQPANYLQTPLRRDSFALFGNYDLTPRLSAYAELLYSETSASSQLAPPPAFVEAAVNLDNPLLTDSQRALFGSNFDPDGDGVAQFIFARRLVETGPRQLTRDADTLRAVLGLKGELSTAWDWELSYSMSDIRGDQIVGNAVFADRFTQALLVDPATGECSDTSNGCVPFNPFGLTIPDDAADFLRTGDVVDGYSVDEDIVNFVVTGDWLELPAGPIGVAVGAEWRELSSQTIADPRFAGGGVLGLLARSNVEGSTDVSEVFVEALVPLLAGAPFADYLGLEAGYRYSDYKFSGTADNWKAGIDWAPLPGLRFRAMAQRAIRAPNIDELFAQASEQPGSLFDTRADFCSASTDPVGNGLTDLCVAQGIPADQVGIYEAQENYPLVEFRGGGNTSLEPETADTFTAGVVLQPERFEGLSLSLDYYSIEIDNAIGGTDLENALRLCGRTGDPLSSFCQPVVRDDSGNIVEYTNPQFNLAELKVEGVDLALNYRFDLGSTLALPGHSAQLALQMLFNYAMENTLRSTPTSTPIDCAGFYGGACRFGVPGFQVIPEYRGSTRLTYYSGPLSVALNWRWIGVIDNHLDTTCEQTPEFCYPSVLDEIDARNYLELSGRYEFGDRVEVYGGVSNLTEEAPPLMGAGAIQSNTAPSLYDVFGRRFFMGFRFRI